MEQYVNLYLKNELFTGIEEEQLLPLLECLQAKKEHFRKGTLLFSAEDRVTKTGIVLSGRINTVYEDIFGGRSIIDVMESGRLFCDAFSCTHLQRLPLHVVAQTECDVLLIESEKLLNSCTKACIFHQRLLQNLIRILAEKYAALNRKIIYLSGRSTRQKLLSYLAEQSRLSKGKPFPISFTQQELADYLFAERSGLSTELNKLKKEGLLTSKNGLYMLHVPDAE